MRVVINMSMMANVDFAVRSLSGREELDSEQRLDWPSRGLTQRVSASWYVPLTSSNPAVYLYRPNGLIYSAKIAIFTAVLDSAFLLHITCEQPIF